MRTHHYPSDITDAQWALIEPHIPPVHPGGRPRKTDVRDVLDAILYHPPHRLPVALSARGLPTQEHRLALLRPVATRRDLGEAPRPPSPQGPHDGEALPPPNVGERRQSVDRHDLRGRAAGP